MDTDSLDAGDKMCDGARDHDVNCCDDRNDACDTTKVSRRVGSRRRQIVCHTTDVSSLRPSSDKKPVAKYNLVVVHELGEPTVLLKVNTSVFRDSNVYKTVHHVVGLILTCLRKQLDHRLHEDDIIQYTSMDIIREAGSSSLFHVPHRESDGKLLTLEDQLAMSTDQVTQYPISGMRDLARIGPYHLVMSDRSVYPRESSKLFGGILLRFVDDLVNHHPKGARIDFEKCFVYYYDASISLSENVSSMAIEVLRRRDQENGNSTTRDAPPQETPLCRARLYRPNWRTHSPIPILTEDDIAHHIAMDEKHELFITFCADDVVSDLASDELHV